jgi:hypothetical protein
MSVRCLDFLRTQACGPLWTTPPGVVPMVYCWYLVPIDLVAVAVYTHLVRILSEAAHSACGRVAAEVYVLAREEQNSTELWRISELPTSGRRWPQTAGHTALWGCHRSEFAADARFGARLGSW